MRKLEPAPDIRFYHREEMKRDILYLQGIIGLASCLDPPTNRETLRQHDRRIYATVSKRYMPSDDVIQSTVASLQQQQQQNPGTSVTLMDPSDAIYMEAPHSTQTRLQTTIRRAMDTNMNIMEAVNHEYMPTFVDLYGRVTELKRDIQRNNSKQGTPALGLEEMDDQIKHLILADPQCPEFIRNLSRDRPSVFDIYASFLKFKPQFVAIQLRQAQDIELGKQSRDRSYFSVFTQMPRGREIVRSIQQQALRENKTSTKRVNFA